MKFNFLLILLVVTVFVSCQNDDIVSTVYPEKVGFYDYDGSGNHRDTGNNLSSGNLTGRVQFGQTHTVEPKGNAELYLPDVISERDALLIFMPTDDIAQSINSISVEIILDGTVKTTLELATPRNIPKSDSLIGTEHEIVYSTKAWTGEISWVYMKKGLELRFITNKDEASRREGTLASGDIEFGAPSVGVFTFIRLGMLTGHRTKGNGYMMDSPAKAMADYFQTAPFAQLVNAKYDNMTLNKVMLSNGVIYDLNSTNPRDRFSKSIGGIYDGDMRGNVAKSQVSVGINLANFGYPSWNMTQTYPKHNFNMTTHLAEGRYQNVKDGKFVTLPTGNTWDHTKYSTVHWHGLSGGNGIGTLFDTLGNEFSHEVGHAYGLGHYVKPNDKPAFWTYHHADSGWGYDVYNKMMKGNLIWDTSATGVKPENNFIGRYNYSADTMSGGRYSSNISKYTRLTGYTVMKSQRYIAAVSPTIVPKLYGGVDENKSTTGFLKWDSEKREMVEYKAPIWPEIYNVVHATPFNPKKIGVPVVTLLGAYMPDDLNSPSNKAVLYPAFRGNYGNVYDFPAPNKTEKACWVEVAYSDGSKKEIVIAPTKHNSKMLANQLHINIELASNPTGATIYCQEKGKGKVPLGNKIVIDFSKLPPMDKAVTIGKGEGYKAAYLEDIKWLNEVLPKYDDVKIFIPLLTVAESTAVLRARSMLSSLNASAKKVAERHVVLLDQRDDVIEFIELNNEKLSANDIDSKNALLALLEKHGFVAKGTVPTVDKNYIIKLRGTGNRCIDSEFQKNPICVDNKSSQEWIMDTVGKLHQADSPNMCLLNTGLHLTLTECSDMILTHHQWGLEGNIQVENQYRILAKGQAKKCIDYASNYGTFITYGCHAGGNQKFEVKNKASTKSWDNKMFSIIPGRELKVIFDTFK